MKFIILFYEHNRNIGIGAIWGDRSQGVRFYGDKSKDYPRSLFYKSRQVAENHARNVVRSYKKVNKDMNLDIDYSYQILPIYEG